MTARKNDQKSAPTNSMLDDEERERICGFLPQVRVREVESPAMSLLGYFLSNSK
jgi:hypothetical protein